MIIDIIIDEVVNVWDKHKHTLWDQTTWVPIIVLPQLTRVTLSRLYNFPESQLLICKFGWIVHTLYYYEN